MHASPVNGELSACEPSMHMHLNLAAAGANSQHLRIQHVGRSATTFLLHQSETTITIFIGPSSPIFPPHPARNATAACIALSHIGMQGSHDTRCSHPSCRNIRAVSYAICEHTVRESKALTRVELVSFLRPMSRLSPLSPSANAKEGKGDIEVEISNKRVVTWIHMVVA